MSGKTYDSLSRFRIVSITCVRVAASIVRSGCSGCAEPTATTDKVNKQKTARRNMTLEAVVVSICTSPSKGLTRIQVSAALRGRPYADVEQGAATECRP